MGEKARRCVVVVINSYIVTVRYLKGGEVDWRVEARSENGARQAAMRASVASGRRHGWCSEVRAV